MVILEENFKWHLEAFASELFILYLVKTVLVLIWSRFWCSWLHLFGHYKTKRPNQI